VCNVLPSPTTDILNIIVVSSRLVQNIRLADDSSTVGVLGKEWDLDIGEQEVEFRDDLRAASGIGKRRRKVWCYHRLFAGLLSIILNSATASWPASRGGAISASQSPHRRGKPSIHRWKDTGEYSNHARSHSNRAPSYVGLVCACKLPP
jgi:hypothetical protein